VQFSQQYVPSTMRNGLDYVFLSYYPTQCGGIMPDSTTVRAYFQQLHTLYPNAKLGFGEVGLPEAVTRTTLARAQQIMTWAYSLKPDLPYYVGGYFWWYGDQDVFNGSKLLASSLAAAFNAEATALAG
jgi:hypothetical protein